MSSCPSLESLFEALEAPHGQSAAKEDLLAHAKDCGACSAIVEEHRQLEKDLFRLADPLPPPDLVMKVMARVSLAPVPRRELKVGLAIFFATVTAAVSAFVLGHGQVAAVGSSVAGSIVFWHGTAVGLSSAVGTVWRTAAVPMVTVMAGVLFASLLSLRKLSGSELSSKGVKVSA